MQNFREQHIDQTLDATFEPRPIDVRPFNNFVAQVAVSGATGSITVRGRIAGGNWMDAPNVPAFTIGGDGTHYFAGPCPFSDLAFVWSGSGTGHLSVYFLAKR